MKNCEIYRKPFDICVDLLECAAVKLDPYFPGGLDYRKINVLLFCVAGPLVLGASIALNVVLALKLARLVR